MSTIFAAGVDALKAGDFSRAERLFLTIVERNGSAHQAWHALSMVAVRAGLPDIAVERARRAVELDSTLVVSRFMLGGVYLEANRIPESIQELEAAVQLSESSTSALGLLGYAYAKSGKTTQATKIATDLESSVGKKAGAAAAAARIYMGLGDKSRALTLLERAASIHDPFFSSESMLESFFDPVRADPRFEALVSRVGLSKRLVSR